MLEKQQKNLDFFFFAQTDPSLQLLPPKGGRRHWLQNNLHFHLWETEFDLSKNPIHLLIRFCGIFWLNKININLFEGDLPLP